MRPQIELLSLLKPFSINFVSRQGFALKDLLIDFCVLLNVTFLLFIFIPVRKVEGIVIHSTNRIFVSRIREIF